MRTKLGLTYINLVRKTQQATREEYHHLPSCLDAYNDHKKVLLYLCAAQAGFEGAVNKFGVNKFALVIIDEARRVVQMLLERGKLDLLAELASHCPVVAYDAQTCAFMNGWLADLARDNKVCVFQGIGVLLNLMTRVDNKPFRCPARLLNEVLIASTECEEGQEKTFGITVDTKFHCIEIALAIQVAFKKIFGLKDIRVIGVPTDGDIHPDVFAQAVELGRLGLFYVVVLVGASKTRRDLLLDMANEEFKETEILL